MTMSPEQVLSEFVDAWAAGRRPSVADFVDRVPEERRPELAAQIGAYLSVAPVPAYAPAEREAIRTEPVVRRVLAATEQEAGMLATELVRLRARRDLSVRDLAARVVASVGLAPAAVDRTEDYLARTERNELDPGRMSGRLFAALGEALGVSAAALADAAALRAGAFRPATAGTAFRAVEPASAEMARQDLDALTAAAMAPAPSALDEVDRLFVGGPEG